MSFAFRYLCGMGEKTEIFLRMADWKAAMTIWRLLCGFACPSVRKQHILMHAAKAAALGAAKRSAPSR